MEQSDQRSPIRRLSSGRERSDQRSPILRLYPPVRSGATKGVISEGYPPVGSGATKGFLSEGYMLVCADQVLHQNHVRHSTFRIKTWRKNIAAIFARFTQLLTIEFPYRRRSMGPGMRLYINLHFVHHYYLCCQSVHHQAELLVVTMVMGPK